MMELTEELRQLRDANPDVATVLDAYMEIDRIYKEILEATGQTGKPKLVVSSSADITVSLKDIPSTSE